MGNATGHRRRTRKLSSQRIILEQITLCLFNTSKECVGSSGNDVDTAGRVHIIPPDHLEMVQHCFLSAAAVQSRNSTHPHYSTQCPPCNLLYLVVISHIHTKVHSPQCPPCNLLYLAAIPHIHTTVHSPHSVHCATCCTWQQFYTSTLRYTVHNVHRATCCTWQQFHTSTLRYTVHTVSTLQPAAFRPEDRGRRFF
jgi:hypothetical protein